MDGLFDKAQSSSDDAKNHINKTQNEIDRIKDEWNEIEAGVEGITSEGPVPVKLIIRYRNYTNSEEYTVLPSTEFKIYKFGEFDENDSIVIDSKFTEYPIFTKGNEGYIDLSTPPDIEKLVELANLLQAYIIGDSKKMEDFVGTTDVNGEATYDLMSNGAYIIIGGRTYVGETIYDPNPQLALGGKRAEWWYSDSGLWAPSTIYNIKYTMYTVPDTVPETTIQRRALVVWEDEGYEDLRPEFVGVELLRDGESWYNRLLDETNNWRTEWDNLDSSYQWQLRVQEDENYQIGVELQGITFVVTMTYVGSDIDVPAEPLG